MIRHAVLGSVTLLLAAGFAVAQEKNSLTAEEKAAGWKLLFDGKSLNGWTPEGEAKWRVVDSIIVCDAGGDGWLRAGDQVKDFALRLEFRNSPQGNSGIFLRAANKGTPYPAPENGYELQINNEEPKFATGSIEDYIQRLHEVKPAPNVWHAFEITAEGTHFVVQLDGDKVLDGNSDKFQTGYVGLQFHKDSKIEFRNIKLKPLGK